MIDSAIQKSVAQKVSAQTWAIWLAFFGLLLCHFWLEAQMRREREESEKRIWALAGRVGKG